jgi:hypothetical protein
MILSPALDRWEKLTEWPLAAVAASFLAVYSVQVLDQPHGTLAIRRANPNLGVDHRCTWHRRRPTPPFDTNEPLGSRHSPQTVSGTRTNGSFIGWFKRTET